MQLSKRARALRQRLWEIPYLNWFNNLRVNYDHQTLPQMG